MEGDPVANDLLAISFYDTKPVYFLSTVVEDVKWLNMSRKIYSKTMQQKVDKFYLRPNFVDINNYDMNSVDRTDHLRTNYSLGQGLR